MRALLVGIDGPTAGAVESELASEWPALELRTAERTDAISDLARDWHPDIVFVDGNAIGACAVIRAVSSAPIVVLLGPNAVDRARAVRLGATTFLKRPFTSRDLIGRVRAALRLATLPFPTAPVPPFEAGSLHIDYASRSVEVGGRPVTLNPAEYGLLFHLTRYADHVISHRTLLSKVWGREFVEEVECLRVNIESLSRKLGEGGLEPPGITSRQRGFVFLSTTTTIRAGQHARAGRDEANE